MVRHSGESRNPFLRFLPFVRVPAHLRRMKRRRSRTGSLPVRGRDLRDSPEEGLSLQNQPPYPPCQGSKPTEEGGFASRCVSRQWLMQTLVPHSRLTPDKGGRGVGFQDRGMTSGAGFFNNPRRRRALFSSPPRRFRRAWPGFRPGCCVCPLP